MERVAECRDMDADDINHLAGVGEGQDVADLFAGGIVVRRDCSVGESARKRQRVGCKRRP